MIAEKLSLCLTKKGVTPYRMSKDINVNQGTVGKWVSGKVVPDLKSMVVIANYFNVSIDYLVDRENIINLKGEIEMYKQNAFEIDSGDIQNLNNGNWFNFYVEKVKKGCFELTRQDVLYITSWVYISLKEKFKDVKISEQEIKFQPNGSNESTVFCVFVEKAYKYGWLIPTDDPELKYFEPGKEYNENFTSCFRFTQKGLSVLNDNFNGFKDIKNAINGDVSGSAFVQGVNNGTVSLDSPRKLTDEETELLKIFSKLDVKSRHKLLALAFSLDEEKK